MDIVVVGIVLGMINSPYLQKSIRIFQGAQNKLCQKESWKVMAHLLHRNISLPSNLTVAEVHVEQHLQQESRASDNSGLPTAEDCAVLRNTLLLRGDGPACTLGSSRSLVSWCWQCIAAPLPWRMLVG